MGVFDAQITIYIVWRLLLVVLRKRNVVIKNVWGEPILFAKAPNRHLIFMWHLR